MDTLVPPGHLAEVGLPPAGSRGGSALTPCCLPSLNCGVQKLISAIYADYARSLKSLGFKQGALVFAAKAAAAGRDLLSELESPKQELAAE